MKHKLFCTLGLMVLALVGFAANPAGAATTAAGPYYANPSWDQTLPSSTRFIVLSNMNSAAVLDRETGLVWEQSPLAPCLNPIFCIPVDPGIRTWFDAEAHCNRLCTGGRLGWRLPTLQALASLVDGDPANTSSPRLPPGHPFIGVQSSLYWSATSFALLTSDAWDVNFGDGSVGVGAKSITNFAWCVRGGQGVDPQ